MDDTPITVLEEIEGVRPSVRPGFGRVGDRGPDRDRGTSGGVPLPSMTIQCSSALPLSIGLQRIGAPVVALVGMSHLLVSVTG